MTAQPDRAVKDDEPLTDDEADSEEFDRELVAEPQSEPERDEDEDKRSAADRDWRGVGGEEQDFIPAKASLMMRARSRRLLGDLLRPYRKLVVVLVAVIVLENAARLAIPYLVKVGIDRGVPPLVDHRGAQEIVKIAAMLAIAAIVQAIARMSFRQLSGRVGQDLLLDLRQRVFDHFQKLSLSFHEKYTSGRVISRQVSDTEAIYELLDNGFDSLVSAVLTLGGTIVLLLVLDVPLALATLISFPILIALTVWFRKHATRAYRRTRETIALVIVHFVESMQGIRAVEAFRREPRNNEIFHQLNNDFRNANLDSMRLMAIYMPGVKLVGNVTMAVVLIFGGYLAFHSYLTVGVLAAFLLYLRQFFQPLQDISQFYNQFQSASAALEKLSGVLEEEPTVAEPQHPRELGRARGQVTFAGTEFAYVPEHPVLPHLDLEVPAGQTVALVGATGAGKTTLAKLVSRFYDPTSGSVLLDGVDLRDLDEETLRRNVVMVTQENFLFTGTIADNIRFGRPDATQEEIEAAARAIGAHTFISKLPQGYDTQVAKRGGRLSAGERQLVSFARAFLADPAVLILDEATSSLDVPSERLVQRALRTILRERTAIIIAHRLSTVEIADRVLVMGAGRILEDGSPDELIAAEGRYADLHQAWEDSLV